MRAIFTQNNLIANTLIVLSEESVHHLNVVRAKLNEEILVLNGLGEKTIGTLVSISKKAGAIQTSDIHREEVKNHFRLAVACPKKDAFEDILKMAIELGITEIQPLSSEFSQYEYAPSERYERLIESALIQSNNLFKPTIHPQIKLETFLNNLNDQLFYFSSKPVEENAAKKPAVNAFILIGPEAGFSEQETAKIAEFSKSISIHLNTAIMRAPTAVAASVGYLLSSLK